MREQSARRLFDQIEYLFKTVGPAVVRVGHVPRIRLRRKFEKQAQPLLRVRRCAASQRLQVLAIHRQDEVEALEVCRLDDAGTQCAQVIAAPRGRGACARIGGLPHMVVGRTGRIELQSQLRRFPSCDCAHHRFGGRGAADVAETDEQYFHISTYEYNSMITSLIVSSPVRDCPPNPVARSALLERTSVKAGAGTQAREPLRQRQPAIEELELPSVEPAAAT